MRECTNCGSLNESGNMFCVQCGKPLGAGAPPARPPRPQQYGYGQPPAGQHTTTPYTAAGPQQMAPPPAPGAVPVAPVVQVAPAKYDGMCTASMVLGICSIVIWPLGVITGILGIVFSKRGKDQLLHDPTLQGQAFATAGFICGIIGTILSALIWLIIIISAASGPYW